MMKIKKICEYCGKEIKPPYKVARRNWEKRKFCNYECFRKNKNPAYKPSKQKILCSSCGKELLRWPCEINPKINRCFQCQFKALEKAGKKTRIKKRQRLSQNTEFKKGLIPWNKGKRAPLHIKRILKDNSKICWKNDFSLYKIFRYHLFSIKSDHQLTNLDKEIIRTRVRLFKIQKKEINHGRQIDGN